MPLSAVRPVDYPLLLAEKVDAVCEMLAPFSVPAPSVYPSQPTGFRLRAEFRTWHEGEDLNYVMYRRDDPKTPVVVTEFPIADQQIQNMMPALREALRGNHCLRNKLFQVEFLATLSGDLLVTLAYHRKLDSVWETEARALRTELLSIAPQLSVIGRSRKQKIVVGSDFVQEVLSVNGDTFKYRQYEQSFSQPNGQVNIQMIEWACERAKALNGDLLELYCGNGNFTLPLARNFDNVIATELSKVSIRAARANLEENAVDNVILVRLSAEEVTQAINAVRVFRRLSELPRPLDQFDLRTLFVDPPRAGLDADTVDMARAFETVLYISCNPQSLAENLKVLQTTHRIQHFALFDQFPYTDHMECGVVLRRV
jgi:tRNA (uracil-5-)-methyltransferase